METVKKYILLPFLCWRLFTDDSSFFSVMFDDADEYKLI